MRMFELQILLYQCAYQLQHLIQSGILMCVQSYFKYGTSLPTQSFKIYIAYQMCVSNFC